MPLGTEVDVGPGDIVLGEDPAPPKGTQPPILGRCLLWPNVWMDQDATWYGGRSQPRPQCVKWGPAPLREGGQQPPALFGPCLWPNGRSPQLLLGSCFILCDVAVERSL